MNDSKNLAVAVINPMEPDSFFVFSFQKLCPVYTSKEWVGYVYACFIRATLLRKVFVERAVTGVYMIILTQENLEKAVDFYKKMGLKLVFYVPGKWSEMEIGGVRIGLSPSPLTPGETRLTGLVFQVEDLMVTYQELKDQGVVFLNEPTVATHGIMVTCMDPSRNVFDLYQPTHEKLKKTLQEAGKWCKDSCEKNGQDACCKNIQKSNGCC